MLNKYIKCNIWRLALRYDIYIYIYVIRRLKVNISYLISILLQHHISKLSRCFWSTFRSVQVSAPYRAVLQVQLFITFFLRFKTHIQGRKWEIKKIVTWLNGEESAKCKPYFVVIKHCLNQAVITNVFLLVYQRVEAWFAVGISCVSKSFEWQVSLCHVCNVLTRLCRLWKCWLFSTKGNVFVTHIVLFSTPTPSGYAAVILHYESGRNRVFRNVCIHPQFHTVS